MTDDRAPRVRWSVAFALFTAAGLLRFTYLYLDDVTRSEAGTFVQRAMEEGTGAYAGLLLFPFIVAIERRFPLTLSRWRRHWPQHLATYVGYTAIHTTLLAVSRAIIFPLLGHGAYDYGRMSVRYFMEAPEDFISYAVLVGILTFVRVQRRLRDGERHTAELERDAAKAKLSALGLRLQPHFLFNALNTISSAVYESPVVADEMIGRLGDLLRRTLDTGDRQEIRLDEELETLRAYLAFVEARFGDRLSVRVDVDPATHSLGVPALVLQPLVENAVRHGSAREFWHSDILIGISLRDRRLHILVENDVAEPPAAAREGTGLGATRDRLALLYASDARLDAAATNGRFRVTIALPAREAPASPPPAIEPAHARADR